MKIVRSIPALAAAATLAVAAFGASAAASAQEVYWSVGLSSPGVHLGLSNAQPVYVQPPPVYVQPQPVYYPAPVLMQSAPVVTYPAYRPHPMPYPVSMRPMVVPAPVVQTAWVPPGHWQHRHGWHGQPWREQERFDPRGGGHR